MDGYCSALLVMQLVIYLLTSRDLLLTSSLRSKVVMSVNVSGAS